MLTCSYFRSHLVYIKKMSTFSVSQEGPINALALNRDNTQVAIGGRNVFKVYSIEEDCFKEVCNLRSSKHLNLSFSCNDVAWSSTDDNYLATAATNGDVCVWNLTKMGKAMQEQVYQEHHRTVNKVNFHASEPNRLISGSQDGTMRYFDIRCKTAVAIFVSNTESVRDVQFSPHVPHTFAAVSENGSVQIWDVRRTDKSLQQFTAHSGPVFACDWHQDFAWLATASRDKTIKVWDLTSKPTLESTIHTIASIGHVKWRPQRKYHIASCALVVDCSINVWDIRRPYIPFASFNEHKDVTSGVAWRGDSQTFLSTSRDCTLYKHAFKDAFRPASKANPQGMTLNNKGDVMYACRVPVSTNSFAKAAGLIRKSSNNLINDFHLASSSLHKFQSPISNDQISFCALAKNYKLSGLFPEICEHNALVAKEWGKGNVSILWRIIKTMYAEEYCQILNNSLSGITREDGLSNINGLSLDHTDNEQRSKAGGETPGAQFSGGDDETENEDQIDHSVLHYDFYSRNGIQKGDFSFGDNELDLELDSLSLGKGVYTSNYRNGLRNTNQLTSQQEDWTLPNEAFNIRHEILDRLPPPDQFRNHNSPDMNEDSQSITVEDQPTSLLSISKLPQKAAWDPSHIVVDTLKHYATVGDVQTAACILTVLGEHRKSLMSLDETTQEHWLLGYIELLGCYKLWNEATEIIKLSWIPGVYTLNQQSTRINSNCSQCSKPLQRVGWLCDRCHTSEIALCSVCHQVVKGLYTWCQGCSHGGHLLHIQKWLSQNKQCPTGCGHICEYR